MCLKDTRALLLYLYPNLLLLEVRVMEHKKMLTDTDREAFLIKPLLLPVQ